MRSTNEIMISVQECKPCSDRELRMCIAALSSRLYFAEHAADGMSEAIKSDSSMLPLLRAGYWRDEAEHRFRSVKMPVDEYLGAGNMPGSPEQIQRLTAGKAFFKEVTGLEL